MRLLAMRERIRMPEPVRWVAAFMTMVGGVAWFSLSPSTLSYWIGGFMSIPFALMAVERGRRKGFDMRRDDYFNDSGPWGGP